MTDVTVNSTTAGALVGDSAAAPIDIGGQTFVSLSWVSATDPDVNSWKIQIAKVINPAVSSFVEKHVDIRSQKGLVTELAELSHDGFDTYTWVNSQTQFDLADMLAPGEVARITIRAKNQSSTIRGYGASFYVTIPVP